MHWGRRSRNGNSGHETARILHNAAERLVALQTRYGALDIENPEQQIPTTFPKPPHFRGVDGSGKELEQLMDVVTAQRFHSSGVQPLRNVSCLLTGQGRFWLQGKPVLGRAAVQQVSVPTVEDCPKPAARHDAR